MSSFLASSKVWPITATESVICSSWVIRPPKVLCMVSIRSRTPVDSAIIGGIWAAICGVSASTLSIWSASALVFSDSLSTLSTPSNIDRRAEHTGMSKQCGSQ